MASITELKKALTTTSAPDLLPYDLDPILHEELLKLQPLASLIPMKQANGKTHEYRLRTSHPLGWFEGETTPANAQGNTYGRKSTMLKIQRIWGEVTGFAQSMDEMFIDALATEITGSLEGMANLMEFSAFNGVSNDVGFTGDAYQYSGLFPYLASYAPENVIDAGGAKVTLSMLDNALARIGKFRQSRNDPKLWAMGLQMKQVVDGLQTRIQIPLTSTVLNDGQIVMSNYAASPIFESDNLVPDTASSSPTDLAGTAASGGTLNASFTYRIASVTMYGEQTAAAASSAVVPSTQKVTLTWTADPAAKLYHIFRKEGSGAWMLLDIIPALTYDANGTVNGTVETYDDTGAKTPKAVKPLEAGEQQILLLNRNDERGVSFLGKVDDMGRPIGNMLSFVDLARVKDAYSYMIKGYHGFICRYPNVAGSIIRNVKMV